MEASPIRRGAIRTFVILYLIVQLTVPVLGLYARGGFPFTPGDLTHWHGGQIYFAWQMFSTSRTSPFYEVAGRAGSTWMVKPVREYGWGGRAHYSAATPSRICDDQPAALAVRHVDRVVWCDRD